VPETPKQQVKRHLRRPGSDVVAAAWK